MSHALRFPRRRDRIRRRLGATFADGFFTGATHLGRFHPGARPHLHGVEVLKDIPYRPTGDDDHRLDVWRPIDRAGPRPVVLYIHGGGFRILSKDSHWIFALAFARRGFTVFNINYRLAGRAPFPAAFEDVSAAYAWMLENAEHYGGDTSRVVVAGESAGGNLSLGLSLATCFDRDEPWARTAFETGRVPDAAVPACGLHEVRNPERFKHMGLPRVAVDRIQEIAAVYADSADVEHEDHLDLLDPVVLLERGHAPDRPLPPMFIPCGTWDFLIHDSRRLAAALLEHGAPAELKEYERGWHAFHAFMPLPAARQVWRDKFEFLERALDMALPDVAPDSAPYRT
jgi:acetyl esterase